MRLVDADAISYKRDIIVTERFPKFGGFNGKIVYSVTKEEIDAMPTVDAVPVVYGRWIKSSRDYDCIVCLECGTRCGTEPFGYGHYLSDFCPSCGADMRKDGDNEQDKKS